MTTQHNRVIGNPNAQAGVDPRAGCSGNAKSRRYYVPAYDAQYCPRKSKCKTPRKCKSCLRYSNFRGK